ncbi:MAG: hypothetical protein J6Z79_04155 [Clostridia bacterium]|nr:hypothetical protein [Clostridia bacterium]
MDEILQITAEKVYKNFPFVRSKFTLFPAICAFPSILVQSKIIANFSGLVKGAFSVFFDFFHG